MRGSAAGKGLFTLEGRSTAQLIADQLREHIIQGIFRPGDQINESIIAVQLNTSRSPVREAVQRLCQEGILINRRNHGVFVLEISAQDSKEIYAVREAMETTAADTLLNSSPKHLKETCRALKTILRNMQKRVDATNRQSIAQLDMEFHTTIVAAAGNSRMTRIYETLAAESTMCILNLEISYPEAQTLIQEHQNILNLLETGNREELRQALKNHLQKAVHDLARSDSQIVASTP
ncbi:GntR family transcriptional regulator [Arthrobacter sp. CDRTa11]|uniref:GntR family transcriptional regulator n=1 Tax=Arthrobacter sp. CDRTa11 TaxID=2651199 RepID=UPI0022658883|nr:GntR family transcriptional regulator [Arthrobacter sp. CDRTa11]UZX05613.1 GntR family transcriptional regulator [Arthrobacter sp. CDRTa11]